MHTLTPASTDMHACARPTAGHYKENECMRQGYEPLMLKYGVDIM